VFVDDCSMMITRHSSCSQALIKGRRDRRGGPGTRRRGGPDGRI